MKLSAILQPLVDAGVDAPTILKAVKAWEDQQSDALERRRANDRERQERRRHVKSRDVTVTVSSCEGVTRGEDNLQTKKISGQEEKKDSLLETEFEREFWPAYPRKVGKRKALKAFVSARKRASLDEILTGLRRYAAERAGEDQQFTKHPEGWLNGDHWTDEPTPKPFPRSSSPPGRRNFADAALDMIGQENGPESIFSSSGNVELLSARRGEPGPDTPDLSGSIGRRFVPGHH